MLRLYGNNIIFRCLLRYSIIIIYMFNCLDLYTFHNNKLLEVSESLHILYTCAVGSVIEMCIMMDLKLPKSNPIPGAPIMCCLDLICQL